MSSIHRDAHRPPPDKLLTEIADYVLEFRADGAEARRIARYCLMDTLGCGVLALSYPACTKLLGPIVPGAELKGGARVPGTRFELDPVTAAFNVGAMIRWLDFNDTWLAAEWGHPSDNLGAILAVADYLCRGRRAAGGSPLTVGDVLTAMIKAHEIQGVLALNHSFNRVGLDHVLLVRIASTAVATQLLGGAREQIVNAVSNAWLDGGALRAYRHAPNTGSRKSWAAGDATSRGVRHAFLALAGEMGYPSALTAQTWGFQDVLFEGKPIELERKLGSYVMENVLFKISFPAEFHAQTAVEAALKLHPEVASRLDVGRADRARDARGGRADHRQDRAARESRGSRSLPPVHGRRAADLRAAHGRRLRGRGRARSADRRAAREDGRHREPRLQPRLSRPRQARDRQRAASVLHGRNADRARLAIDYPVGHRRRRAEGIPLLLAKFNASLATRFGAAQIARIEAACAEQAALEAHGRRRVRLALGERAVSAGAKLRDAVAERAPLQIPGTINAYCALLAERAGFEAIYLSGAGVANASFGLPDLGVTTLNDVVEDARRITAATDLPLLVDADTGFGSAFNIARTVRELERAGVAGMHIEDQEQAKRCGHRPNKATVSTGEMCDRLKAAVDARADRCVRDHGADRRVRARGRCRRRSSARRHTSRPGADMVFAEALYTLDDYRAFTRAIGVPVLANLTEFGLTPLFTADELGAAGVKLILYPLSAFRAMSRAALEVYTAIREQGTQKPVVAKMQTREELYGVLDYHAYERKLDELYARSPAAASGVRERPRSRTGARNKTAKSRKGKRR